MKRAMRALAAAVLAITVWFNVVAHRPAEDEPDELADLPEEAQPITPAYDDTHEIQAMNERRQAYEAKQARARSAEVVRRAEVAQVKPKQVAVSRGQSTQEAVSQTYEATFYTAFCNTGCIGITATGLDVRNTIYSPAGHRIIAVDPAQIKLGSLVELTFADGSKMRAVAEDTGGSIRNKRIDVLVASRDEALRLGRQSVEVRIIRKGR